MPKDNSFVNNMAKGQEGIELNHHTDYIKKDMMIRDLTEKETNMVDEWMKTHSVKKIGNFKEPEGSSGLKMFLW